MPAKLSKTMIEALDRARSHDGVLERSPGGYWTYPGCRLTNLHVPEWYVATGTIIALLDRDCMVATETNKYGEPCKVKVK
jgi:hypothetical protein